MKEEKTMELARSREVIDRFGRPMRSLRLSVTDRCNLACSYCIPLSGPGKLSPRSEILTFEEIVRVVRVMARLGVESLRLTGGEPLLRTGIEELIGMLRGIEGIKDIALTTNGYLLEKYIPLLEQNGLDRINFSLDTFRADRFERITRRKGVFAKVWRSLETLTRSGYFQPIKLNTVVIRGFNDDEILDFVDWAVDNGQSVRFIEFMPLEGGAEWEKRKVITQEEIISLISRKYELEPHRPQGFMPAAMFRVKGTKGAVGFISSVSRPFCANCDRVRLTADGNMKNCLFAYEETDLRTPLRAGCSDEELEKIIVGNYQEKWEGGCVKLAKGEYDPSRISRTMSRIGG